MRSNLNLDSIKRSLSGLSESIKTAKTNSDQISDSVTKRNEVKKESLSMSSKLFARRRDNLRRRDKEDLIEAGGVMGAFRARTRAVRNQTKGFLGRILDFLATVLIGWAVLNLPKIIKLAEGVMKRLKKFFDIVEGFATSTIEFFTGLGARFTEMTELVGKFDFVNIKNQIEKFMRKVQDAFTKITLTTIRDVRNFLDKSDKELAEELGIKDLYDQLVNGEGDGIDSSDVNEDSEETDEEDDSDSDLDKEKLIMDGIEMLKQQQNGKLTDKQQNLLDEKNYKELDKELSKNGIILLIDKDNGFISYLPYENKKDPGLQYKGNEDLFREQNIFPYQRDSDGYTDIFDPTKTSSDQNSKDNVLPPGSITPPAKNKPDLDTDTESNDIIIDIPPSDSIDSLIDSMNKAAGIPTDGDINNGNLTNKNFNDAMYNSIP
jgi:hypothetical protein